MEYPNMVIIGLQVCPTTPTEEGGLPQVYGQTELHSVYQASLNFMARLCPKSKVIMKYFSVSKNWGSCHLRKQLNLGDIYFVKYQDNYWMVSLVQNPKYCHRSRECDDAVRRKTGRWSKGRKSQLDMVISGSLSESSNGPCTRGQHKKWILKQHNEALMDGMFTCCLWQQLHRTILLTKFICYS